MNWANAPQPFAGMMSFRGESIVIGDRMFWMLPMAARITF